MNLKQKYILDKATHMLTQMEAFCFDNPAVKTPATRQAYKEVADALHQILLDSYEE